MKKTKMIDLETLKDTDLLSLSMFLLFSLRDNPKYNVLGELPYLVDRDSLMNMCRYFGGKTITLPTTKELSDTMRALLLYQMHIVEGKPWGVSLVEAGYVSSEFDGAKKAFNALLKTMKEYNIGIGDLYGN